MKKVILIVLICAVFLLSGCVKKSFYPSEKEVIDRHWEVLKDATYDRYFIFTPRTIDNVTIQREMSVERKVGNLVTMVIHITGEKTGKVTNIEIREIIPVTLIRDVEKINFKTGYSEILKRDAPISIAWRFTFSGEERIVKDIVYQVEVFKEIDKEWVESYLNSPYIEIGVVSPEENPVFLAITSGLEGYFDFLEKTFADYYFAVAVLAATMLCLILLILEFVAIFSAFISSMTKREKFSEEVFKFIGHGRKDILTWILVGVVLIVVGAAIISFTTEVAESAGMEWIERLSTNIPKAVGVIAMIIGVVSVYYVVIDQIKGLIFGKRYFMTAIDIARSLIENISKKIDDLEERLSELTGMGIDTSTETVMLGVERRRAQRISSELDVENAEAYLPILRRSFSDVEASIDSLIDKKNVYRDWPKWREAIDRMLATTDKVTPDMLADVPEHWRRWSLTKYLSEHLGEALTIEAGALTKIRIAAVEKGELDLVIGELTRAGKIDGVAAVRKDGLLIASNMPTGIDPNIIAAIAAKFIANADMVSLELEKGKSQFAVIRSAGGETIVYAGKKVILICLVKPGEATGFVVSSAEKTVDRLDQLLT